MKISATEYGFRDSCIVVLYFKQGKWRIYMKNIMINFGYMVLGACCGLLILLVLIEFCGVDKKHLQSVRTEDIKNELIYLTKDSIVVRNSWGNSLTIVEGCDKVGTIKIDGVEYVECVVNGKVMIRMEK